MSRKLTRLVLAGSVAAAFTVAPTFSAYAAERNVFATDARFSGKVDPETQKPTTDALPGDRVIWNITNGEHTVRPDETVGAAWPATAQPSEKLTPESPKYAVTFDKAGKYHFYCELHDGMVGVIDVKDQTSSTTPPPPPPTNNSSTTTTTKPAVVPGPTTTTTSAPASSAGTKPPGTAAPAPTTTTTKPAKDSKDGKDGKDNKDKKKDDKPKEDETTTTTVAPPPPPVDIPDSAIIPVLPGAATGTTTQNGIEAPTSTPEGEAIALLKSKKSNGGKAMKLLILSGVGLGALGIGTAGYKWANRSSRYFPA